MKKNPALLKDETCLNSMNIKLRIVFIIVDTKCEFYLHLTHPCHPFFTDSKNELNSSHEIS